MHIYSELTHSHTQTKKGEQKEIGVETHRLTKRTPNSKGEGTQCCAPGPLSKRVGRHGWTRGPCVLCCARRRAQSMHGAYEKRRLSVTKGRATRLTQIARTKSVAQWWCGFLLVFVYSARLHTKCDGHQIESENRKLYAIKNTVIYENTRERSWRSH